MPKIAKSDMKVLAAKLAQVLANPQKTDSFLSGKVEYKGKPLTISKFLAMQK